MPKFVELFAGGGLVRSGLGAGWACVYANDWSASKAETYRANYGNAELREKDIREVTDNELPKADLLWASFPCQDHSTAGSRSGFTDGVRGRLVVPPAGPTRARRGPGQRPAYRRARERFRAAQRRRRRGFREPPHRAGVHRLPRRRHGHRRRALAPTFAPAGFHCRVCGRDADSGRAHRKASSRSVVSQGAGPRAHCAAPCRGPASALVDAARAFDPNSGAKRSRRAFRVRVREVAHAGERHNAARDLPPGRHRAPVGSAPGGRADVRYRGPQALRPDQAGGGALLLRTDGTVSCFMGKPDLHYSQLLRVDGHRAGIRPFTIAEFGRLMRVPEDYRMPSTVRQAAKLSGEGVAVPVVRWLATHLLEPLSAAGSVSGEKPAVTRGRPRPTRARKEIQASLRPGAKLKQKTIGTTAYLLPEESARVHELAAGVGVSVHELLMKGLDRMFMERGLSPVRRDGRDRAKAVSALSGMS